MREVKCTCDMCHTEVGSELDLYAISIWKPHLGDSLSEEAGRRELCKTCRNWIWDKIDEKLEQKIRRRK